MNWNVKNNNNKYFRGFQNDDDYPFEKFETILKGQKQSGWSLAEAERVDFADIKQAADNAENERLRQQCVLLFVPASDLYLEDNLRVETINAFLGRAKLANVSSIIVLSKMDTAVPPQFATTGVIDKDVNDLIKIAAEKFNVPAHMVMPMVSYQRERTFALDKIAAALLLKVIEVTRLRKAKIDFDDDDDWHSEVLRSCYFEALIVFSRRCRRRTTRYRRQRS